MKNKLKSFVIVSALLIFIHKISYSKEILINSQEINLYENGNVIVAINGTASSKEDFIQIFADRIEYQKKEKFLANKSFVILEIIILK